MPADVKLWSKEGMIGERVQNGFLHSMGKASVDAVCGQLGVGIGTNAGIDKPLRNVGSYQKFNEYDDTGKDHQKQRIEGYLDI